MNKIRLYRMSQNSMKWGGINWNKSRMGQARLEWNGKEQNEIGKDDENSLE